MLGKLADHSARSIFSQNVLGLPGLNILRVRRLDIESLISDYRLSQSPVVVVTGKDDHYEQYVPVLAARLQELEALVILATNPREKRSEYEDSGIGGFVYMGCDVIAILENIMNRIEGHRELT